MQSTAYQLVLGLSSVCRIMWNELISKPKNKVINLYKTTVNNINYTNQAKLIASLGQL